MATPNGLSIADDINPSDYETRTIHNGTATEWRRARSPQGATIRHAMALLHDAPSIDIVTLRGRTAKFEVRRLPV